MTIDGPRVLRRIGMAVALMLLSACAARPYAGINIYGPSYGYGPVRVGTGVNIGIPLPRVW